MMNTSLEDLNDAQYEALKQLKKNISDVLPSDLSDTWLLKWLRAHSYNLKQTEMMFRATMRLREVYKFDTIVEDYIIPEVAEKYGFTSFLGFAKNGSPIRYTRGGAIDQNGFMLSMHGYDIALYCSHIAESDLAALKKENERTGRNVHEITYILDMENFSLTQIMNKMVLETGLDLVQMIQDHYPEVWGNIFVINAPSFIDKAFNIFKPILRLNLLRKIRFASRESTPQLLLKYIDEDVLPAFLGGKRVDGFGNPRCTEFIKFGGRIPEDYYLRNRTPLLPSDPGVTDMWLAARSVFNYSVVIRKAPSKMHIKFRTENGSINYKMLFREFGNDPDDIDLPACDEYLDESNPKSNVLFVSPALTMQSHATPVDHVVKAPWPGIYIFKFDNTYSWFSSRRIIFRIKEIKDS